MKTSGVTTYWRGCAATRNVDCTVAKNTRCQGTTPDVSITSNLYLQSTLFF